MTLKQKLITYINRNGHEVKVRGLKTREVLFYSFIIDKFDYNKIDYDEKYVVKKIKKYEDDMKRVIKKLKKDRNSRQCIVQFDTTKSLPECIICIHFLIRNNCLYCVVASRSLDVKTKLFTDIEIARRFCNIIERNFDVELQYIKFNVGSLHYYV